MALTAVLESIRRYKKQGNKIVRRFVCPSGPRKGQAVAHLSVCFLPRKRAITRVKLRKAANRTKAIRAVKSRIGMRKAIHFKLVRLNKQFK